MGEEGRCEECEGRVGEEGRCEECGGRGGGGEV